MRDVNNIFYNSIENIANKIFEKTTFGSLEVVFPSGKFLRYNGLYQGVDAKIKLNNYAMIIKLLRKGPLGFAESYIDGDFYTKNLTNLLIFAKNNESSFIDSIRGKLIYKFMDKIYHYFNNNTKYKSKKNISYHYDLGNDFYKLWLDESMTYSSGIFEMPDDDLPKAQLNKYKKIIEPMQLNENSSLLEIGCGWGSFSTYVAKNFKAKINAITNSKKHFEYTSKKIMNEGLNETVKVQFRDYRDITFNYS